MYIYCERLNFFKAPIFLLDSLDLKNVDFLIGGEIEFAAVNIINKINKNQSNFLEVPGIYVRENGIWRESKFDNWNKEIDDLPLPNRKKLIIIFISDQIQVNLKQLSPLPEVALQLVSIV